VTVVLASEGYPSDAKVGTPITGIKNTSNSFVYHAGTKKEDGVLKSSGGRVLTVTGIGKNLSEARNHAYENISSITLSGSFYRNDIALSASQLGNG
jgi:phosphoribosylamine--glycine ligase